MEVSGEELQWKELVEGGWGEEYHEGAGTGRGRAAGRANRADGVSNKMLTDFQLNCN